MFKQCVIRLGTNAAYKDRKKLLQDIEHEIMSGAYSPRPIHGFLSVPKGNGVARFVPVLTCYDFAVYFACVKAFDELLALTAVEDTFGGWTLAACQREPEWTSI